MRPSPSLPAAPFAALLVACGGGGSALPASYEASAYCHVERARVLVESAPTPFDATVAELFASAVGEHRGTLTYATGDTTPLVVRVTLADTPAFLVEQASGPPYDVGGCGTDVQRRATISYETADGQLAESFETILHAGPGRRVATSDDRSPMQLEGSLAVPGTLAGCEHPLFTLQCAFGPNAGGAVDARATFSTPGVLEARVARIGTFTFDPE